MAAAGAEIHLLATPNDTNFGSQWDMTKISAPAAWNTTTGSLKVVVADIDTGIDYNHIDLYKNVWINQNEIPALNKAAIKTALGLGASDQITFWDLNSLPESQWNATTIVDANADHRIDARDVLAGWADGAVTDDGNGYADDLVGWNFVNNSNNPFDDNGHGTHTAGTIGAVGNNATGVAGVNWQVQIMALKILDSSGGGDLFDAAAAIRYAAANGAQVSNNSWGFYDSGETVTGSKYTYLYNAIAETPNVLFVAAAGNNGLNNDTHWARNYPSSYNLGNIVAVAATNAKDGKASFSNYGKATVDLGAPGLNILSTVPGNSYAYYSGTSMATPHVAGAAALALAKYPTLSTTGVKSAILAGVDKISSMSKTVSGGRLNLSKMLSAASTAQGSTAGTGGSTSTGGTSGKGRSSSQSNLGSGGSLTDEDAAAIVPAILLADPGFVVTGPTQRADVFVANGAAAAPANPVPAANTPAWLSLTYAGSGADWWSEPEIMEPDAEVPVPSGRNDQTATPVAAPIFAKPLAFTDGEFVPPIDFDEAESIMPMSDAPPELFVDATAKPWSKAFWLTSAVALFVNGACFDRSKSERKNHEQDLAWPVR